MYELFVFGYILYNHVVYTQWKITFFVVKIVLAVIATIVLGAGTIQGAASYTEYCNDDDVSYLDHNLDSNGYFGSYVSVEQDYKRCDFYSDERQHDPDVDFLTIVIVIAVATLFWVSTHVLHYILITLVIWPGVHTNRMLQCPIQHMRRLECIHILICIYAATSK